MNRQTVLLAAIFVAFTILVFVPVGAASIGIIPSAVTVQKGATTEINLVLDDAPSGLAGYDLVIRFSNPSVAEIAEVSFPSWAALNNMTRKADGSVRISGVDLSRQVSPGMTNVPLATLIVRAVSGGTSSVSIESVNMDADGGAMITPDHATGQIYVPGGSVAPSGGGGGGGDSYLVTPTPTSIIASPPATVTLVQSTSQPSPVFTEPTAEPSVTSTQGAPQVEAVVTLQVPEEGGGIPWMWFLGGIIVLSALFLVGFIAWKKEQE
jgi:hypothetical protein